MSVYPRPDGVYVYDFQIKGIRFYGPTGTKSRRAAQEFERAQREREKQRLATVRDQRHGPMTINTAFDRFWAEVGDGYNGSYRATVWGALRWMSKEFGPNTLLRDLGPNRITEAIARRRGEGVKNATVNRTLTELLRTITRRARRLWEQELPEIIWGDLLLPEPKERIRELRDHEEQKISASMRQDYLPIIAFSLVSGMRKKELVALKWADIDFTARTVSILGKGDKAATIPLTDDMAAILSTLKGHHPVYVFTYLAVATRRGPLVRMRGIRYPITYSGLSTAWRRFGPSKAKVDDFRFHDNRHTIASRLLRETGNLRLVQRLLRHEEIATSAKYAHADDADLRAGLDSLEKSRKIPRIVGSERAKNGGAS